MPNYEKDFCTPNPRVRRSKTRRCCKANALNTVLIAEDDPIFRRVLQSWFTRWDYQVTAVENGLDAWEILQKDDAPQLAMLDWIMPGMDGIELCRRIRGRDNGPYRYVILLTAKDHKEDVVAGLEAGADDYLTKPFDVEELRARVRAGKRILDLQAALIRAQSALQFEAAHDGLTGHLEPQRHPRFADRRNGTEPP